MFRQAIKIGLNLSAPKSVAPRTWSPVIVVARQTMATYKTTTGLVGLNVDPNGRETMQTICKDVLTSVQVRNRDFFISKIDA